MKNRGKTQKTQVQMPAAQMIEMARVSPSVHNPRIIRAGDPGLQELAESIEATGMLYPVIVRPRGDDYELLAGRRRYEAHLILGRREIEAVVRDLSDDEALDVTVTENLQREDLAPLEEARGVKELLASGRDVADVAARLGKSEAWVRRRARLMQLSPAWLEVLSGPMPQEPKRMKTVTEFRERVSVAVLEIAAHLPERTQNAVLKDVLKDDWQIGSRLGSAARFRECIAAYCRNLDGAPWKESDTLPGMPTCGACVCRSDIEPDLFNGIDGGGGDDACDRTTPAHCLDERCFKEKYEAWVAAARSKAEVKLKHNVITVADGYNRNAPKPDVQGWGVKQAKKGDKNAVPALRVDGPHAGKVEWVILPKSEIAKQEEAEPESIEDQRTAHICQELKAWLEHQETCPPALQDTGRMLVAVAVYGCDLFNVIAKTPDEFDKAAAGDRPLFWDECWNGVKTGMEDECYVRGGAAAKDDVSDIDLVLHVCGLDKQDFLDSAARAFPEPEALCRCGHDRAAHGVPGAPGESGVCRTCGAGKHGCDAYRPADAKKKRAGKVKGGHK